MLYREPFGGGADRDVPRVWWPTDPLRWLREMSNLHLLAMPVIKKAPRRPWQPEREVQGGRRIDNQKFYQGTPWRKLRHLQLARFPLCAECERKGIFTPGRVADHIVPMSQGGAALSLDNLQTLCDRCHNVKSGQESHRI